MGTPPLLVAGSLTIDNVRTADGTLLPRRPGGNVVFAALGARLWNNRVGLVSRAGADYPADTLDALAALGLDLGGVSRVPAPHGMNVAFSYAPDGSRVRVFPPAVMAAIPPEERPRFTDYTAAGPDARFATWHAFSPDAADLPPGWAAGARAVHLAAMPVNSHLSLAPALAPARIHVDSPWHDERTPEVDLHTRLLSAIDLLLPSEADLLLWRPHAPPLDTASALAEATSCPVLVKLGAGGAALVGSGPGFGGFRRLRWPAVPCRVADLTGAGDAFCGGFLAGFYATGDVAEAGARATVSASFAVGGVGTAGLFGIDPAEAQRRLGWVRARIEEEKA